mmetsp:Transcript_24443/g.57939  ORF Transcript_24443/g.57939 Transcript_24443/m.57939 type:complete len:764 (-) Transcript_24443:64-2355(-)
MTQQQQRPSSSLAVLPRVLQDGGGGSGGEDPTAAPKPPKPAPTEAPTFLETEAPTPWTQMKAGVADNHEVGFQSDWGPSYASSMVYDFTRHAIYLTGVNYKDKRTTSSCFLGHVPLMHLHNWKTVTEPPGGDTEDQSNDEILACTALASPDGAIGSGVDDPNHLWLVGYNERNSNDRTSNQREFITAYSRDRQHVDWDVALQTYAEVKADSGIELQLPQAVIVQPEKKLLYVASIISNDATITPAYYKAEDSLPYPNTVAGGGQLLKRGMDYSSMYRWYEYDDKYTKLTVKGEQKFQSDKDMFVSGMAVVGSSEQWIVVTGSMNGQPVDKTAAQNLKKPKSAKPANKDDPPPPPSLNDMDGYLVMLQLADGQPTKVSLRLDSFQHGHDWIFNVCSSPPDDANPHGAVFVVGSTTSSFDPNNSAGSGEGGDSDDGIDGSIISGTNAFVAKLKVTDNAFETEWTREFHATSDDDGSGATDGRAEAVACHVIPHNPDVLYVGGTVYDGARLSYRSLGGNNELKSHGGNDVFVAQLDSYDGVVNWVRQVGSSGDEILARNNGLFADAEGDAVIYGDTTGPLYRSRGVDGTQSDVFVMKLDYESGSYAKTVQEGSSSSSGGFAGFLGMILVTVGLIGTMYYLYDNEYCRVGWFNARSSYNKYRRRNLKKNYDDDGVGYTDEDGDDANGEDENGEFDGVKKMKPFRDEDDDDVPEPNPSRGSRAGRGGGSRRSVSDPEPSHPNGTLEMSMMPSKSYKDDPSYRPGRMFV